MTLHKLRRIDWKTVDWWNELKNNITSIDKLLEYIPLDKDEEKRLRRVVDNHPMNIPRYYASLIDPDDPDDPIRKLSLPHEDELIIAGESGETTADPYGDDKHDKGNGILHKYPYSALIVATDYCSMYCRHCFRKAIVGLPNDKTVENFHEAIKYVKAHPEITNLIISGGDPMLIDTPKLKKMLEPLKQIDHLNFVRIGTRTPVVYPLRFFDDELLEYLREFNRHKTLYMPTHFNHPSEITDLAKEAVLKIRQTGVTVNNQAVLLKGINDDPDTLETLMSRLTKIGVNPYYLYQCMPVSRVRDHFQVPLREAVDLVDAARTRMDGYAKRFKFIMGHDSGKIEICGRQGDLLFLKRIHSRPEEPERASEMLVRRMDDTAGWLEDTDPVNL